MTRWDKRGRLSYAYDVANASVQCCNHFVDLIRCGNQRWTKGDPVGIKAAEQAVLQRALPDTLAELKLGVEVLLGVTILDKLDSL